MKLKHLVIHIGNLNIIATQLYAMSNAGTVISIDPKAAREAADIVASTAEALKEWLPDIEIGGQDDPPSD